MDRCWNKKRSNAPITAVAHTESDSSQVAPSSVVPSGRASGSNITLSAVDFETIVN
jgi:hypothetical protein